MNNLSSTPSVPLNRLYIENQLIQRDQATPASTLKKIGATVKKNALTAQYNSMLSKPLDNAIQEGNLNKVKTLVKLGAPLPCSVESALQAKKKEIFNYFISRAANLPFHSENFIQALALSIQENWTSENEILALQLSHNIYNPENKQTPLQRGIEYNLDINTIKELMSKNDINAQDSDGNTALHLAINKNRADIVRELMSHPEIKFQLQNNESKDTIEKIIASRNTTLFEIFMELHPKNIISNRRSYIRFSPIFDGMTILNKILKLLQDNNINGHSLLNVHSEEGTTPLHMAAHHGNLDATQFLLKNNANPSQKNKIGETPIHLALNQGCFEVYAILINEKKSLDIQFSQYLDTGSIDPTLNDNTAFTQNPNLDNKIVRKRFEAFFNVKIKPIPHTNSNVSNSLGFKIQAKNQGHHTDSALLCTHGKEKHSFFNHDGNTRLSFVGPAHHILYSDTMNLNKSIKNENGLTRYCDMREGTNAQTLPGERLRNIRLSPSDGDEISVKKICQSLAYLQLTENRIHDIFILNPYNREANRISLKKFLPIIAGTRHNKVPYKDLLIECCRGLPGDTTETGKKYIAPNTLNSVKKDPRFKVADMEATTVT